METIGQKRNANDVVILEGMLVFILMIMIK